MESHQGLNSTPHANSPSKAMSQDGQTNTNIKFKADVFIHQYARVSKLNMSSADRNLNQQFKKSLNAPSVDNEGCAPLQMGELLSAIKKILVLRTFYPHFLSYSFHLAVQELLSIFGSFFPLAYLDFSKAYGTAWREKLMLYMIDTGIPFIFINWILPFFNNHRPHV